MPTILRNVLSRLPHQGDLRPLLTRRHAVAALLRSWPLAFASLPDFDGLAGDVMPVDLARLGVPRD